MARYRREHSAPNISNGMMWLVGIFALAYLTWKIVSCNQKVRAVYEHELEEQKAKQTEK